MAGCGTATEGSLSASTAVSADAASGEGEPPERMMIDGVEVKRSELAPFELVQVEQDNPARLVLLAGQDSPGKPNPCSLEAVVRRLAENDKQVRVAVYLYRTVQELGPNEGCPGVGYPAARFVVPLEQPLGGRSVVDASTDKAVTVIDPAQLLRLTEVPDGYKPAGQLSIDQLPSRGGLVTMWTHEGAQPGTAIHLRQGDPAAVEPPADATLQTLGRYTVHGHPAVFNQAPNFPDVKCMRWRESEELSAVLCTRGDPAAPLDGDAVARLAEATTVGR